MRFNILKKGLKHLFERFIFTPLDRYRVISFISRTRPRKTNRDLIRLGGDSDGGYLVPDDLENIQALFSPGVGLISDFELDCAKLGMEVFMADGSVENPSLDHFKFKFLKKFLGRKNDSKFITLEKWISETGVNEIEDLMLQMDIEGHEYDAINSTSSKTLERFRIIVIEFHNLNNLWEKEYYKKANSAFKKILKTHFCVHIHPNNCCGIKRILELEVPIVAEFTFIRKDRIKPKGYVNNFPHELDRNNMNNPSIVLPEVWYKSNFR